MSVALRCVSMDRRNTAPRKPAARSAVANGSIVPKGVDGRTIWVRRLYDVRALYTEDMGGDDALSEGQRSLIMRIATQTVAIEKLEARFAMDGEADERAMDLHQRLSNTLRRNQEALGLKRKTRDLVPTLDAYIAERGG